MSQGPTKLIVPRFNLLLVLAFVTACGSSLRQGSTDISETDSVKALGPNYYLLPITSKEERPRNLGSIILEKPNFGQSFEAMERDNPCARFLKASVWEIPMENTFEDVMKLSLNAGINIDLGKYGLGASGFKATHFGYKFQTKYKAEQRDSADYYSCCKERADCGYGYISHLVYGNITYFAVDASKIKGEVKITVAGLETGLYKEARKERKMEGWVAAHIKPTDFKADSQKPDSPKKAWGASLLAAGGVSIAFGGVSTALAAVHGDRMADAGYDYENEKSLSQTWSGVMWAGYGVGVGLCGIGIQLLVSGKKEDRKNNLALLPVFDRQYAALAIAGDW